MHSGDLARRRFCFAAERTRTDAEGQERSNGVSEGRERAYNVAVARLDSVDITSLLKAWGRGDQVALDQLMPLVYDRLRAQARRHMRRSVQVRCCRPLRSSTRSICGWHAARTSTGTIACTSSPCQRSSCAASSSMLRERAPRRSGRRRAGSNHSSAVDLDQIPTAESSASSLCALDDALESLTRIDPRRAQVVELRFFGGLSVEETAEALQVSPQTVMRDWRLARAWLARELRSERIAA